MDMMVWLLGDVEIIAWLPGDVDIVAWLIGGVASSFSAIYCWLAPDISPLILTH